MMIELNSDDLTILTNFEHISRVMPSEYVATENFMIFIVAPAQLGKALGNRGANIEKLRKTFRKRVIIIKDSDNLNEFIHNFFANVTIYAMEERNIMGENNVVVTIDEKDRGIAIGRAGERIKAAKNLLKKKFNATIQLRTKRAIYTPMGTEIPVPEAAANESDQMGQNTEKNETTSLADEGKDNL